MKTQSIQCVIAALMVIPVLISATAWGVDATQHHYTIYGDSPYLMLDEDSDNYEVHWFLKNNSLLNEGFSIQWENTMNGIPDREGIPFKIEEFTPDNLLYLDAQKRVGINTTTPSNELDIRSGSPAIRLDDNGADQGRVDLDMSDNEFAIQGNSNQEIVEIDTRAPSHSLTTDSLGDVGIGLTDALADLHVRGEGSGTSEELLRLESSTKPQMKIMNSSTGRNWILGMNAQNDLILYANETGKTAAKFRGNGNLIIAGTLTENSDRDSKREVTPVDNQKILDAVVGLPITTWEYESNEGVKHLGPMAQDFHAAFGLGDTPKGISSIDTGGVALAAIKGLNEVVQAKDKVIESLREESRQLSEAKGREIASLKAANDELSVRLTMLENLVNKLTAKEVVMNQ